jgi:hypothetical protein
VFAATESPEVAVARQGQTLLTTPNCVHLSKRLEAWHVAGGGTKSGGQMKVKEALELGSPILILQAPPMLKTAEPMPMLRPNVGTHLLWGCWPILHIEAHGFSFL